MSSAEPLKSEGTDGGGKAKSPDGDPRKTKRRPGKSGPSSHQGSMPKQTKFEGKCEELTTGHIFDCTDVRQSDQYSKTVKEIAEFVGRTYKYGADARSAIEHLVRPNLQEPSDPPDNATKTQL